MVELSLKIDHSKKRLGNLWGTQRNYLIAGLFLTALIVACMVWALMFVNETDFNRGQLTDPKYRKEYGYVTGSVFLVDSIGLLYWTLKLIKTLSRDF